ncbi:adenylate/guanylate cyclase domain-containing protein [Modestobacter excelsi]|uniref:adenylate/guanylate cyclase domain-containing protein n=1 Tax=Modestobacter excelsi TaxID=2213161 RepID=UPI001C20F417|nr:adenylate/guanylate cyclase domain-containing protein [Modestobacter excelsi]
MGADVADQPTGAGPDPPAAPALPCGTVTFLFTDIAGSTRLVREDQAAYAIALEEHRRLLRATFTGFGGREVDTQGDSFFVVFPTAARAVAAGAQAQRALAAYRWPDGIRLLVRMGLHTGEATPVGDSFVGLAVHQAARIAASAHGGQVLLSATTAALVGEELPAGTALHRLGGHRLKDFPRPVTLYQLDIDGLPTAFPALRSLGRSPMLLDPTGQLLGREGDIAALASLLSQAQTRMVTVTGPGGIGKTSLALQTARTIAAGFPGGVVLVPLTAVADAGLVLGTVAEAVGAPRELGIDLVDAISATLAQDRTLLVLDNFEHVVAAGPGIAALLAAAPAAVALVTSRRALRLRSERQYPLAPLGERAAVDLFAARAAAVRPGFSVDATNEAAVTELCRRLDGLPLAIELAAARTRLLPPAALLARLGERLDVLGGPVDLPERQRTLRATMDWSFGLLGPHEQAVFVRLAAFSGGWTPDAADAVCGRPGEPDVLGALSVLLDASLLVEPDAADSEPRFDMLETVRTYAVEKLTASADRPETERRHTDWVLSMTEPLPRVGRREFADLLARLDADRANLRAALQRAVDALDVDTFARLLRSASPYLSRRDGERETAGWLDQMLSRATGAPEDLRGRLLVLRALLAGLLGHETEVRPFLDEGRRFLPDDPEHAYDQGIAAYAGVFAAMADGCVDEASRSVEEAARRWAAIGRESGVGFTVLLRAHLAVLRGDLAAAEQHYGEAVEIAGRLGDEALLGQALSLWGLVLLTRGDLTGGRRAVLDAAAANRGSGQPSRVAASLEGLAALALADGRPAVAARALAAADQARRRVATMLFPAVAPLVEDLGARAREQLGEPAHAAASEEGRRWPLLEALDRTLAEAGRPPETQSRQETR